MNSIEKLNPMTLPEKIENVLMKGDLSALSDNERLQYYKSVCDSVGLNPLTQPFSYIVLNERLTLYANKACTDQLRALHNISIEISNRERIGDVYVVTARAKKSDGRVDESTGAVALSKEDGEWVKAQSGKNYFKKNGLLKNLNGDDLANAYLKAETKAKRRVTLSICGLGLLDESEVESIPGAVKPTLATDTSIEKTLTESTEQPEEIEPTIPEPTLPGDRIINYGKKYAGKKFKEFTHQQIQSYVDWMKTEGKDQSEAGKQFIEDAEEYLTEDVPF